MQVLLGAVIFLWQTGQLIGESVVTSHNSYFPRAAPMLAVFATLELMRLSDSLVCTVTWIFKADGCCDGLSNLDVLLFLQFHFI